MEGLGIPLDHKLASTISKKDMVNILARESSEQVVTVKHKKGGISTKFSWSTACPQGFRCTNDGV